MPSTIRDIADEAKVSCSTVSLVLNRRPGVGIETRKRVIEIAERLNYKSLPLQPYPSAKLRTIRFLRIAKHGHIINPSHNVFIADYIDGLESEAKSSGYSLEVSAYGTFIPDEILRSLEESSVAGVVVLGTELSEADVSAFAAAKMPVVFIDTFQASAGFDFVDMNNDSSVFSIVSYLKDLGHRRIGLVKGSIETRNFRLRERSFAEALEHYGLPCDEQSVFAIDSTYAKGSEDMSALLKSRSTPPDRALLRRRRDCLRLHEGAQGQRLFHSERYFRGWFRRSPFQWLYGSRTHIGQGLQAADWATCDAIGAEAHLSSRYAL